jgi:hypothetical protein
MASLESHIASWLSNYPGLIRGDSVENCFQNAFDTTGFAKRGVELPNFTDSLKRLGYDAQPRRQGGVGKTYWVLALPERPLSAAR